MQARCVQTMAVLCVAAAIVFAGATAAFSAKNERAGKNNRTVKKEQKKEQTVKNERYDLIYVWDSDLDSILDYKEELEELFEEKIVRRLKIVGNGNEYGVIYDMNASAKQVAREIARQGMILRNAGLLEANGIVDEGYAQLFNVCYGLGPNLEELRQRYDRIYSYLGDDLGKRLYIERTDQKNYALIFRLRALHERAVTVAAQHQQMLQAKKIKTTLTTENNNEVVYGESNHLDDFEEVVAKEKVAESNTLQPVSRIDKQKTSQPPLAAEVREQPRPRREAPREQTVTATRDTRLERSLVQFVEDLHKKGLLDSNERSSWAVYDLEHSQSLVEINANELFQAASMIKPFVALAFFHQVQAGKAKYDPKAKRMVEAMIQRSSNEATNWVMRQAGGPKQCELILRQRYTSIFKKTVITEYIPSGGKTYKNKALPADYIRFLEALWNRELPYGKELRRVMALPGSDRIYQGTTIPHGTLVYNKTGSTARLCGDMGILVPKDKSGRQFPYAIVGIIERDSSANDYASWMRQRGNVIRQVSSKVYEEMKKIR